MEGKKGYERYRSRPESEIIVTFACNFVGMNRKAVTNVILYYFVLRNI